MEEVAEGKDFSFPKEELKILRLWDELDAFHEQLKRTEGKPEYIFYDGPPFATGLPHYGHILAGTIKDIVTRYASATGHHVIRRFGWDCHGLPVEFEINKKLKINGREDVLKMGIAAYNEECRSIVMRYSKEWEKTVHRLGRWIDFDTGYKTMDASFMETVWWVFNQLFDKGLVYKGFKVMPFSTGLSTPLSNFEAGQAYKEVDDPAVMVTFPVEGDEHGASLIAWTTTPWTLPSNVALCVHPELTYVKVRDPVKDKVYIVAESRLASLPGAIPKKKKDSDKPQGGFEVISKCQGKELVGKRYTPLFPYFMHLAPQAFRVVSDTYVTDDSGTGIVHQAPAFGVDDHRVCLAFEIVQKDKLPCPVDLDGRFTAEVTDFVGLHVKAADKDITAKVKEAGRLFDAATYHHSYPFCWRSDTPLIYRAVPSWFVNVESIKDKLVQNNVETYWVPSYVKEKRFHNWLEGAHDWAVSRSRFWGTPIPIWTSDDGEEIVCVGSVAELEELTGEKVTDLHRHFIDHLTIPSKMGKGVLRRVDDVFDCWFESGSMPYGQLHYPFENKQLFEANFPADFVAEGLDQTRGWFYTLIVLSTALFDKPAFKNLVCNGLVLAADGKKMSKSLRNYPDPGEILDKFGADALRLYLINSPVVRAEPLRFKDEGVFGVVKDVFLPWYNAYRFLVQNVVRWELEGGPSSPRFHPLSPAELGGATNVLDRWIAAACRSLTNYVREEMMAYRLYTVVPYLVKFIDSLTNVYVRYNRKRMKGVTGREDAHMALASLYDVLLSVCKVMAPFTPFLTEHMYQNLSKCMPASVAQPSVHFCDFPAQQPPQPGDERIQLSVDRMQRVVELVRTIRERKNKPVKFPLKGLIVVHTDTVFLDDIQGELKEFVCSELNIRSLETCSDPLKFATLRAEPDWQALGKRLGKALNVVSKAVKELPGDKIMQFETDGFVEVEGHRLITGDIKVIHDFKAPEGTSGEELDANGDGEVLAVLNLQVDTELVQAGLAREVINRFQKLRKKAGLVVSDSVEVFYESAVPPAAHGHHPAASTSAASTSAAVLDGMLASPCGHTIREALGRPLLPLSRKAAYAVVIASEVTTVGSEEDGTLAHFKAVLAVPSVTFNWEALKVACSGSEELAEGVSVFLASRDLSRLQSEAYGAGGSLSVVVDAKRVFLKVGTHVFFSASAAATMAS
ncbi:hypothetical protein CEUSTIGMA_g4475.t1 [Chlamydomonas eustigma]|uniref:isoleucine--tRNA ligase n=1 Tax=Chlamydomonas eustigma TaxID=1157962 RepID=A0A250X1S9_9CHLO|nr:hypothetical protein CEUSTIGMA_g4475.t1 [Chlamydomonas eustigma]|eukprot:GAX77028.1 hypothetical protein CEUSTIGMA_g4475.t1 [Chlamydomonas eustigma]